MKKTIGTFIAALVVGVVVGVATQADAGPKLRPNSAYFDLTKCDGGVNAIITPGGSYVMTVLNETTWLCSNDAGCAVAGQPFSASLSMSIDFDDQTPISCRSVSGTGELTLTYKAPGT